MPPVKIIVTSGHVKVTEESLPTGALFEPKPYDPAGITQKVREMIAAWSFYVYVAWTDRPRVAVTGRKIKTFRMGCARVKWIARGILSMSAQVPSNWPQKL
jgi:hypothetical protein